MPDNQNSTGSLAEATRGRAEFSSHHGSLGIAGYKTLQIHSEECEFLGNSGDTLSASPPKDGFKDITIGAAWDNVGAAKKRSFFKKLLGPKPKGVDLDLGCLYELKDGTVGAVQAFGNIYGNYEIAPFIHHTGDETTGDTDGYDESMHINGQQWNNVKRILIYIYIYDGVTKWADVNPQIQILVPDQKPMVVTLQTHHSELEVSAIAEIENLRGGLRIKNLSEYFPGHAEMDRAFGYGLEWDDGEK